MRQARTFAVIVFAAAVALLTGAQAALAQVSGDSSEIPEASPKNWSIQFVAEPLMLLAIGVVVLCAIVYAWKMIRLRYPRG